MKTHFTPGLAQVLTASPPTVPMQPAPRERRRTMMQQPAPGSGPDAAALDDRGGREGGRSCCVPLDHAKISEVQRQNGLLFLVALTILANVDDAAQHLGIPARALGFGVDGFHVFGDCGLLGLKIFDTLNQSAQLSVAFGHWSV